MSKKKRSKKDLTKYIGLTTEDGRVVCQECRLAFGQIHINHLKIHNMTTKEYKEKHPYAILVSKEFIKACKTPRKESIKGKTKMIECPYSHGLYEAQLCADKYSRCPKCFEEGLKPHPNKKHKKNKIEKLKDSGLTYYHIELLNMLKDIIKETHANYYIENFDCYVRIAIPELKLIIESNNLSNEVKNNLISDGWKFLSFDGSLPIMHKLVSTIENLM